MIDVKGSAILENEVVILEKLRSDCLVSGMELFKTIKYSGTNNLMTNCPFHKFGQERKPSFGISTKNGVCHCFTCGWSGSFSQMVSQVFGYDDSGSYGDRWLSRNFLSYAVQNRPNIQIGVRTANNKVNVYPGFTEEELDKYRYFHPYMFERGLDERIIEDFDIGYDFDTDCITFPCYDIDRTPLFIARRSCKTKFFNYPSDIDKPVYGADRFVSGLYKEAVICESIFNALTCWKYNIPAVALLGTGTISQYEILKKLPVRHYILGLDNDVAGNEGARKLKKYLSPYKIITQYDIPEGKDINDLDGNVLKLKQFY